MKIIKLFFIIFICAVTILLIKLFNPEQNDDVLSSSYLASSETQVPLYDLEYNKVLMATRGIEVSSYSKEIVKEEETYKRIKYNNVEYLVNSNNIVNDSSDAVKEKKLYVRTSSTIYKSIDTAEILSFVKKGEEVSIIGFDKLNTDGTVNKYKISYKGYEGYVYSKYLVKTKEESLAIYDENDIVSKKLVYSSDDGAIFVSAKYAEEIQKTANEEKMNYSALSEYIERYEEAQRFGMEVSDYIERYEKLQAYEEAVQRPAYLDEKAKIFGVIDKSILWNQPENLTEEDYAALEANWNISEREIAEEVARLINEYRVENGVGELDFSDSLLQQVADIRAVELTYVMDKAHSRPWLGNTSTFAIGENAASAPVIYKDMMIEYSSESIARTLFEGWKNSPGHNANMLEATYAEGSVGIKFSYVNGNLIVYAGTPFYNGDYENTVSELVRNRIALGAQTNYSHAGEYNSELSNLIHGYTTREDVAQKTDDDTINYIDEGLASEESTSEGTVIVKDGIKYNYNLKVLDTSGNKFQLPNGADWVRADSQLWWYEGLYSADGQGHDLYFSAEDGNRYMLHIYPTMRTMDTVYTSTGTWTNNFVGDTIIIAPCDDGFTTIEQFGLSFESLYCTKQCYYITNGELIILDYEGNVTE